MRHANVASHLSNERRRFLFATATVISGTTAIPLGLATETRTAFPALKMIIVSDTHLGYRDQDHATSQWEKTVTQINQLPADMILHLGDIVDGGREEKYPVYLQARKKLDKPIYEIPGNHDPHALFQKYIRPSIDTVVELQWLRILLLGNARPESHDGFLSSDQLSWLESQFQAAEQDQKYLLVGMHVPAHTNRHPDRGWHIKPGFGQTEFYELTKRYAKRILGLLHGHFHNGVRGWQDQAGLQEIVFPSALYNQDRKLAAQSAPGYNLPEFRPGVTLLTLDAHQMHLQYQPLGWAASVEKSYSLELS